MPGVLAVIPARLGSTRFPEKVLAADTGRPLVQHVVDRTRLATTIDDVLVATDAEQVADALRPYGTAVAMTSPDHASGTDRCAEVAATRDDVQIIVNVQGDEPEIDPAHLDRLVLALRDSPADMATLVTPFPAGEDVTHPTRVKAVVSDVGGWRRAVYFSRAAVPFDRDGIGVRRWLHVGVYAYRRDFLLRLTALPPSPLEVAERLEQLRAIEHGHAIAAVEVDAPAGGIDTPEQYAAFVERHRSA